jgi:hypothetical protein
MHPSKKVRAMRNFFMFACQFFGCKNFSDMIFLCRIASFHDLDLANEMAYSLRSKRVVRNDMEVASWTYLRKRSFPCAHSARVGDSFAT